MSNIPANGAGASNKVDDVSNGKMEGDIDFIGADSEIAEDNVEYVEDTVVSGGVEDADGGVGWRDKLVSGFRQSAGDLKRRFTGEVTPEDLENVDGGRFDIAKAIAKGAISVAMTYTGTKFFVDMPQFLSQKYFTAKERKGILEVIDSSDFDIDGDRGDRVDRNRNAIVERIQGSKFLSEEKKAELIDKLQGVHDRYQGEYAQFEEDRNREFAEILDDAIQSRISNTAMLKETMNTALIATGVASFRTIGYSAVALYERHNKVQGERVDGEREGSYFSEMVSEGLQSLWKDLVAGGGAETGKERAMTRVKALTTLSRAASLGSLMSGELASGQIGDIINKSIENFQNKGIFAGMAGNLGEHFGIGGGNESGLGATGGEAEAGVEVGIPPTSESGYDIGDGDKIANVGGEVKVDLKGAFEDKDLSGAADGVKDGIDGEVLKDTANVFDTGGSVEISADNAKDVIALATVGADSGHNSITGLIEAQIKASPDTFGFDGDADDLNDWAESEAIKVARAQEFIRDSGDTRLSIESIDNLAVVATFKDGEIGVQFLDIDSGGLMNADALRESGFVYEHGSGAFGGDGLVGRGVEAGGVVEAGGEVGDAVEKSAHMLSGEAYDMALVGRDGEHNSIFALLDAQIKSDPARFGYNAGDGDVDAWAREVANRGLAESGLIDSDSHISLTESSVGNLVVEAVPGDYGIEVRFIDSDSGEVYDLDGLRDEGYVFDEADVSGGAVETSMERFNRISAENHAFDSEYASADSLAEKEAALEKIARLKLSDREFNVAATADADVRYNVSTGGNEFTIFREWNSGDPVVRVVDGSGDVSVMFNDIPDGSNTGVLSYGREDIVESAGVNGAEDVEAMDTESVEGVRESVSGRYDHIGELSSMRESSGDPGAIGKEAVGYSYGTYQLNNQNAVDFLKGSPWASEFDGLKLNSQEFRDTWRAVAEHDPDAFTVAQHEFIGETHYAPAIAKLDAHGVDTGKFSDVMKDVVWSTAVQHGARTNVLVDAFDVAGPGASEADIIREIYKARWDGGAQFARNSDSVRAHVYDRLFGANGEMKEALSRLS